MGDQRTRVAAPRPDTIGRPRDRGIPTPRGRGPLLNDFRRRVDQFWGHPKSKELRQTLSVGRRAPSRLGPVSALRSRLRDTLAILQSMPNEAEFRLERGLTYRDGRLVAFWGDDRPLPPDERLLVVTMTTTIVDPESMAVASDVLVFEREGTL